MKKWLKKKIINKYIVASIVFMLFICGIASFGNSVKTSAEDVALEKWCFFQEGQYNWGEGTDCAYIRDVNMKQTREKIEDWKKATEYPASETRQKKMAKYISNGFWLYIDTTGEKYDTNAPQKITPDGIKASMELIGVLKNHTYKITFKAKAASRKNAYIDFGKDEINNSVVDEEGRTAERLIALTDEYKEFTYQFVSSNNQYIDFIMELGAFSVPTYPDGTDASDIITDTDNQKNWRGTVEVSDFLIEDLGSSEQSTETSSDDSTEYESTSKSIVTTQVDPTTTTSKGVEPTHKQKQHITISDNALKKIKKKKYTTKKFDLGAKSSGDGKLSYSSNNKKVIKVSRSGQIKMNGYGKATVVIKATSTNRYEASKRTINITVNPPKPAIKVSYDKMTSKGKDYRIRVNKYKGAKRYYYQFSKSKKFKGKPISKKINHVRLTVYKNSKIRMRARASVKYYLNESKYITKKLKWSKVKIVKN